MAASQETDNTQRNLDNGSASVITTMKIASMSKMSFSIDSILGMEHEAVGKSHTDDSLQVQSLVEKPSSIEQLKPLSAPGCRDDTVLGYEPHIVTAAPDTFDLRLPINHSTSTPVSAFERLPQYRKFAKLSICHFFTNLCSVIPSCVCVGLVHDFPRAEKCIIDMQTARRKV